MIFMLVDKRIAVCDKGHQSEPIWWIIFRVIRANWDKMHSMQTKHPTEHYQAGITRNILWHPIDPVIFSTVLKDHEQAVANTPDYPDSNSFIPFGAKYWA